MHPLRTATTALLALSLVTGLAVGLPSSTAAAWPDDGPVVTYVGGVWYCYGLAATIVGTNMPDIIVGGAGNDVIVALAGNDNVDGGPGNDTICLGAGDDLGYGGDGRDRIFGEWGDDKLYGEQDNDGLYGMAGDDVHYGGAGMLDDCVDGLGVNLFFGCP